MPLPPKQSTLREVEKRSVQITEEATSPTIFLIAAHADECPRWWSTARDAYLRRFFPTESYLAGAIYSVCARNAAYRLTFRGPDKGVENAWRLVTTANMYKGWLNFSQKLSLDVYTQDNCGFIEIIRPARIKTKENGEARAVKIFDYDDNATWAAIGRNGKPVPVVGDYKIVDNPIDLPIGINHLDAAKCTRTSDPEYPVIYTDSDGVPHKLHWWQIATIDDQPSADETKNGICYCAVTRALRLAQTLRDMTILKQEKVSGRFAGRIYLTNVSADIIQDAVGVAKAHSDNMGLTRYQPPIIADTVEPNATPAVASIDLASLPENYDEEMALRWYIAGLALGFGVDYGFLAPLPGNKLGTSEQATVAERQSRGKASRLYMAQLEERFNYYGLLQKDVWMEFAEVDITEELERDTARHRRALTRKVMIDSGEITPEAARAMAVEEGDYDANYLDIIEEGDYPVNPEVQQGVGNADDRQGNVGFGKVAPELALEPTESKSWPVSKKAKRIMEIIRR